MAEPTGESAWLSLVDDESRSAGDLERRVEVVELYKKALGAEPYSLRLWLAYCEWMWSLYTDCQSGDAGWLEEEQLLGQELFSLETAVDVWEQGAQATRYRLSDSHVLWNRWIAVELEQLAADPEDEERIERVRKLFMDRLQVPHAAWDETSQMFSTFITKYDETAWEETMIRITKASKPAKQLYEEREEHEIKLRQVVESGNVEAQQAIIHEYTDWEFIQSRKKKGNPMLYFALYERCLIIAGTNASLWEDYVSRVSSYLNDSANRDQNEPEHSIAPDLLSLLQRATAHCPWSGSLWSRYLLQAEIEDLSYPEMEQIKHGATSSGQLDRDGMADVLAMYSAWCGYLRRIALRIDASDDDIDLADMGFSSALEDVQEWGERLYGKDKYKGDPQFRLQQGWIQYMTQKGGINEARGQWNRLVKTHGDNYEFWQQYYLWEMIVHRGSTPPSLATSVLKQAVQRRNMDWPEKILEMCLQHCNIYEDAESLGTAVDLVQRNARSVAKRRQREAAEAAAAYAVQQQYQQEPAANQDVPGGVDGSPTGISKRKRESVSDVGDMSNKKIRLNIDEEKSLHLKRDRENTSILVTNLPPKVTQTKVRQYFKEYGHINNLDLKTEADEASSTALIEFNSTDDVQSSLLRDGKFFLDKQINVIPGTGLTLYVTNYPPTADEGYLRNLFKDCGDVFNIRWPSLKFNTLRRFCYITFRSPDASALATQLDGKLLEGRFKLEAKYSNPSNKKKREGAVSEGRELHVTGIDRSATDEDVQELFSKYGVVESLRIMKNMGGKSKGFGFVVFKKKDEAEQALELDKTKFMTQVLRVEFSTATKFKPTATSILSGESTTSPAPDADGDSRMTASPAAGSEGSNFESSHAPSRAEIAARTITLMNIPDTINDARIRALVEPYGTVAKIVLRPDHQGAIIEFADEAGAGKASLALENYEIVEGRKLRTGNLKDLFQQTEEIKTDRIQMGAAAKKQAAPVGFLQPAAPVRRPGGRGGLGTKRGLGFAAAKAPSSNTNGSASSSDGSSAPKSNADFKAMFIKGKE